MKIIGLTGSIGMGKSAVAAMLRRLHVPVFDADAAVHILQGRGGALLPAIEARFPGTTGPGGVDRARLGALVLGDRVELRALERIVHPAVARMRSRFLRFNRSRPIVVLDIPLLYEKGGAKGMAAVIVVSAPLFVQRRRVLRRKGMTEQKFRQILARQVPDRIKRRRADHIIETARTKTRTFADVRRLVTCLRRR
ncbi:dephospho-CoA kinase [Sphingobium sufflavum]|uniref:dephospho-CoA kinase n=1 Tax=Sphingobium sufflavum TaxID=1129547 RepID=UPI001EEB2683|nr:dephospho-CoA kinase [Sphingobium sufflavum]MCE7795067.1 dephospho-CoA kinase [Sphingobium sufflavum]